jgi:hypothetical protein
MPAERNERFYIAFLRFAGIRTALLQMLLDFGNRSSFQYVLDRYDDALSILWTLLSEEEQLKATDVIYLTGLENLDGTLKPWSVDIVERIEGLPGCLVRAEVRLVRQWITRLMEALGVTSFGALCTILGVHNPSTIESY